jgi:uncharacterized protein
MWPALGSEVRVKRRKWPDAPHYEMTGRVLGEDDYGIWVGARAGSKVVLPNRTEIPGERNAVWCVPRDEWFLVHFWHGHPEVDTYVDICTPAVWSELEVKMVDLDFDVVVWSEARGGHVELVDEDEFEEHSVAFDYPEDLVVNARRAAADVFARVQAREAPFTLAAADRWLRLLGSVAP